MTDLLPPRLPQSYNLNHEPIDLETEEGRAEHIRVWRSPERQVAYDVIDGVEFSTAFLVLDQDISAEKPVLYETAVYGKGIELDGGNALRIVRRYTTREEAEDGHEQIVKSWRRAISELQQRINPEGME